VGHLHCVDMKGFCLYRVRVRATCSFSIKLSEWVGVSERIGIVLGIVRGLELGVELEKMWEVLLC
jgi:hypothetical protein